MLKAITEYFVKKPLIVNLITLFVIMAGLLQIPRLLVETFPFIPVDIVVINTIYPGATSSDVEFEITKEIEDAIDGISGIKLTRSVSIENASVVIVELDKDYPEKEKIKTIRDIRTAVDRINTFPTDAEDPIIEEIVIESPVVSIGLTHPRGDPLKLQQALEDLEDKFRKIRGVKDITKFGYREKEIWVQLNLNRLEQYALTQGNVIQSIQQNHVNLPAGDFESRSNTFAIRTIGESKSLAELGSMVVRSNFDGASIRIRDLGQVVSTLEKAKNFFQFNQKRGVVLTALRSVTGQEIEVSQKAHELINDFNKNNPYEVKAKIFEDNSKYVKRRLGVLLNNAWMGLIFVLITLVLFLGFRTSAMTALGIPFAFLLTILFMSYTHTSINVISMLGLIIVLGMIVDDAIIISENIARHLEMGKSPHQAAIDGLLEVAGPVFMTVITTIVAFAPLALMTGIMGKVMKIVPVIVIFALIASLLEAFFLLPSHVAELNHKRKAKQQPLEEKKKHIFMDALIRGYEKIARALFKLRYVTVFGIFLLFALSIVFAATQMRFTLFPEDAVEAFFIKTEAPIGTSLEKNHQYMQSIEKKLRSYPKNVVVDFVTSVGSNGEMIRDSEIKTGSRLGQIAVYMTASNHRNISVETVMDEMRKYIENLHHFSDLVIEQQALGPPVGSPIYIKLKGPEFETLDRVGRPIFEYVKSLKGTKEVRFSYDSKTPEVHFKVRQDQVARFGLSNSLVAREIKTAFDGFNTAVMEYQGDKVDIRVKLSESGLNLYQLANRIQVDNGRGGKIPLSQLVQIVKTESPSRIVHDNGQRMISILGKVDVKQLSAQEVVKAVNQKFQNPFKNYPGYSIEFSGENEETSESLQSLFNSFILAIFAVFFILVGYFNSLQRPFIVMTSIPFSMIGVIFAFYTHGVPLSFPAMMGIVGLMGVVVNDAIVLVTFIENYRAEGHSLFEAVLTGAKTRLRPILLTSITTMAGLLPTAYGWGGFDPFLKPMALAFAWGIAFSTLLTLFIIPSVYLIQEDVHRILIKLWSKIFFWKKKAEIPN